ncbi:lysophospholipid acyltransferase family protein [Thalassolituus oleivorans]|uniref:lysophospholipid acyltransferase family protein n=1 Tax=Thalassolituus oleivorans TaxID=187493 RepID=UPI0023F3B67F|nr:lysophospholipid acyltransferase family protein [Thalassolituus oleivorans]
MKNIIGYLMIAVIKLLGRVSLPTAQKIGRRVGIYLWGRRTRAREVARVNLGLVYPNKSAEERDLLVQETLIQNGMIGAEMGPMWGYETAKGLALIRTVYGEELVEAGIKDKRGLLILAPHLGNWEILNNYISSKCPVTIMYRPAKSPVFNEWMVERRETVGCKLVPTTRDGVAALFSVLEQGGTVGFLPDQEPRLKSGVFAPFMGIETLTPKLPYEMIQKTGAQVIYAFAKRLPNAEGFDLYFTAAEDGIYSDDARTCATSMNQSIEELIKIAPAQYQWTYKRFKRRPEGQKNPYSEAKVP